MHTLEAEKRSLTGKAVKSLRSQGMLPGVIYGAKTQSQPISVSAKSFRKVLEEAGESTLVELTVDGHPHNVLIHEVLRDPVTDAPLHADFLAVQMDKEIHTKVPVEFVGESPAVKNEGGVLVKVMHEVEISALPKDLPPHIVADISSLANLNDKLALSDIPFPNGVKALVDLDEVVALVEPPRSEEELKALESEPTATVEVMTEQEAKRKADEEAASAAGEASTE